MSKTALDQVMERVLSQVDDKDHSVRVVELLKQYKDRKGLALFAAKLESQLRDILDAFKKEPNNRESTTTSKRTSK